MRTDVDIAVEQALKRTPAQLLTATIRSTPESLTDPVYVSIDAQSRTTRRGPCPWMPRGAARPQAGDRAWVQADNTGQLIVIAWDGDDADLADPRLPTQDEKAALEGTAGSPSANNRYVTDDDQRLALPSVTGLSFGAGWQNANESEMAVYYLHAGRVYLRGLIHRVSGTGTVIGTLPSGFRPPNFSRFPVASLGAYGQVRVDPDGTINFITGSVADVDLSAVDFRIA